jgi:protein TilB
LTGNPCESWKSLKDYVIARIPQLRRFNGSDVLRSERIKAVQSLKLLEQELEKLAVENKKKEPVQEEGYTPESRTKMYKDLMEKQQQEEEEKKQRQTKSYTDDLDKYLNEPPPVYNAEGEIRQCNQGKYKFKFLDNWDDEDIIFELYVPKFLDTSLINVDLNPLYVRIDVKGKITQIKFEQEIIVAKSKVQRSTTTGALQLICPKLNFDQSLKNKKKNGKEVKKEEKKKLEPIKLAHLLKKGEKEEELLKVIYIITYRKYQQFH